MASISFEAFGGPLTRQVSVIPGLLGFDFAKISFLHLTTPKRFRAMLLSHADGLVVSRKYHCPLMRMLAV